MQPHYPAAAPIDAYGNGGFRFAGMSHRGSLLCLPSGIWQWPVTQPQDIDEVALAPLFAEADAIGITLIGTGRTSLVPPAALRSRFDQAGLTCEVMTTGSAVHTYNILLAERRPVAAALIAVD